MHHSQIVQDINDAVHQALADNLYQLDEGELTKRADELLERLPVVGETQPTTEQLLRRYHVQLHAELCQNHQPRVRAETVEDEVRELTRAVIVTMGSGEALSVETAATIGLVLYKRGLAAFCTLPSTVAGLD